MAGGNHPPKPPSNNKQTPPSSSKKKSRWDPPAGKNPSSAAAASGSGDPNSKPSPKPLNPNNHPNPNQKPINHNNNPSPKPDPNTQTHLSLLPPFPFRDPPPPPSYGFHMLERRTMVLADGSVRSYFALPLDYQDFPRPEFRVGPGLGFDDGLMRNRNQEYWNSERAHVVGGENNNIAMKRKFGDEGGKDVLERLRQQVLEHGNAGGLPAHGMSSLHMGRGGEEMIRPPAKYMRTEGSGSSRISRHNEVDQTALKKSFLLMVKLIYENANLKRSFLTDGKQGHLQCLACNRASKDFPDMHTLIMHAYNSNSADSLVEHLAFHKALCVLMGWNYLAPPDNSKSYQMLSADEATANRDDLVLWPPLVIIHNTITGKRDDGRMEGLGNKAMDSYLRGIGFHNGKVKALYNREGHLGVTLVKFPSLMDAVRLAEYFEKDNRGRKGWARLQPVTLVKDDENNPDLVKVDHRTGEKKRVFYGYLGTVSDLEKVDFDSRKKITIASRSDHVTSG
ncbi:PREDICTED: uncharacterized protein LOC109225173 [Nicotiana attenuata]|uniref:XS domain-containing protein n=1 Tax=Nicotiana attenuata TaxID=49451 RepID=A0A1J6IDL8_NICAT|nr:PREDICTED: uncharacterized protein LOC109225173 [Nicotiana attenuata]OIT02982.1 hypothetical protein A4A49_11410 [Nicotiana attenuata]